VYTAQAEETWAPENGKFSYVVSHIEYVLGPDAEPSGACPDGMTTGYGSIVEVFDTLPESLKNIDPKDEQQIGRAFRAVRNDPTLKNYCIDPELAEPDPRFKTVSGKDIPVPGLDIDALYAQSKNFTPPGTCAHEDFTSPDGTPGVDNQFYRFSGCSPSFQSTGMSNIFATEMLTGSWGTLIEIEGIDDINNDDEVTVSLYANDDPIRLSTERKPLPYGTYASQADPHYRATTSGRIRNGVLTTDPVDWHSHWVVNSMFEDRPLDDAVMQLKLGQDGTLEGIIAGYAQIEEIYSFMYGYRTARDRFGNLAETTLRVGSSIGKAMVQGHTCQGAYQALYRMADGHRDPETGQCHSISMQYKIEAIPAFIVDGQLVESEPAEEQQVKTEEATEANRIY